MKIRLDGKIYDAELRRSGASTTLWLDGVAVPVELRPRGPGRVEVLVAGRQHEVLVADGEVWTDGRSRRPERVITERKGGAVVASAPGRASAAPGTPPMPGRVTAVHVAVGEPVEVGQRLISLTAMKMEVVVRAARAGTVREVRVAVGDSVKSGQAVVEVSDG